MTTEPEEKTRSLFDIHHPSGFFGGFPPELVLSVAKHLSIRDLRSFSSSNSHIRKLVAPILFQSIRVTDTLEQDREDLFVLKLGEHVQDLFLKCHRWNTFPPFDQTQNRAMCGSVDRIFEKKGFPKCDSVTLEFDPVFSTWRGYETCCVVHQAWAAAATNSHVAKLKVIGFTSTSPRPLINALTLQMLRRLQDLELGVWSEKPPISLCKPSEPTEWEMFFGHLKGFDLEKLERLTLSVYREPSYISPEHPLGLWMGYRGFNPPRNFSPLNIKASNLRALCLRSLIINKYLVQLIDGCSGSLEELELRDCASDALCTVAGNPTGNGSYLTWAEFWTKIREITRKPLKVIAVPEAIKTKERKLPDPMFTEESGPALPGVMFPESPEASLGWKYSPWFMYNATAEAEHAARLRDYAEYTLLMSELEKRREEKELSMQMELLGDDEISDQSPQETVG